MYKTTIGIEGQLQKIAAENCEYGELWSTWNLNKKTLEPILNAIIKDYPHYSLHDRSHSESILLNIERALGNENIEKLSPTDLWLLLHVSYLHDFGMVILDSKIHEFWTKTEFNDFLLEQSKSTDDDAKKAANIILNFGKCEDEYSNIWPLDVRSAVTLLISIYCRWQHSSFSSEYILDLDKIWGIDLGHNGLIKRRFISTLADISAMHTKQFEEVFTLPKESNGYKNDYMHPRLIACLLRLGDVLDLDNSRFNLYGEKIFGKMPVSSKVHYEKHEATKHVLITNDIIEVEADCPTDEIYRETRRWYDSLKSEIDNLHLNWSDIATVEFSHPPKLNPYKILRNGVEDSSELSSLKFSISQNKAFEILEGSAIYKDKFSCIREIVQNAEDATKIQLWRDIKSGMYYSPNGIDRSKVENQTLLPSDIPEWVYKIYSIQITVEENEDNNAVLSVVDHGTGISIDALKAICNVGQSYFQKQESKREIEDMPVWLRPTANFGIGLQSCFMVTDTITIFTNSNKDGAFKITFKSGKQEGYVNVEASQEFRSRGSRVVIEFENNLNFSYDMFGFTANKLMEVEPFESNCVIIYKLIESVFKECDSSFFDINVDSNSANFSDTINAHKSSDSNFPTKLLSDDCLYYLDIEKGSISYWYNNNLYKILLNKNCHGEVNVKFKGKSVRKTKIAGYTYRGFLINVDVYGMSAKDSLSINREELNYDASSKICEDINHLIKCYFDILVNNSDEIQNKTELVDAFMLTAWLYETTFPESLHKSVSDDSTIRILKLKNNDPENEYEASTISLHEMAKQYPHIPYVNYDVYPDKRMGMQSLTESELITNLKNSGLEGEKYSVLIIDNEIRQFLLLGCSNKIFLACDKPQTICVVPEDNEIYSPDVQSRNYLLRNLVCTDENYHRSNRNFITRRAVPAFSEFAKLAVDLKDVYFIGCDVSSKWYIISPISLKDSKRIKQFSKEAFVNYITNQSTFDNLVQYVSKHGKTIVSKETIISEYKRLIECYYDITGKTQSES